MIKLGYSINLQTNAIALYSDLEMVKGVLLTGIMDRDNVNLFITNDDKLKFYPGGETANVTARMRTRRYELSNRSLRKILVKFEGSITLKIYVYNDRFPEKEISYTVSNLETNKWKGLPNGLKGDHFEIDIEGPDVIEEIRLGVR